MRPSVVLRLGVPMMAVMLFMTNAIAGSKFAPPAGSKVINRIEESSDWQTCGDCGNDGGSGAKAKFNMTRGITNPTIDGSSTEFWVGGSHPFKNAYWFIEHHDSPTKRLSYLRYEFDLYIPSESANAPQAIEFECQQKADGYTYNFAWQADYADRAWRVYDFKEKRWQRTGLAFAGLAPNRWHHIIADFHTESGLVVHDALTVDGELHIVGIRQAAKRSGSGHYLTNAFQLDLNENPTAYKVYVDNMSLTYK